MLTLTAVILTAAVVIGLVGYMLDRLVGWIGNKVTRGTSVS